MIPITIDKLEAAGTYRNGTIHRWKITDTEGRVWRSWMKEFRTAKVGDTINCLLSNRDGWLVGRKKSVNVVRPMSLDPLSSKLVDALAIKRFDGNVSAAARACIVRCAELVEKELRQ